MNPDRASELGKARMLSERLIQDDSRRFFNAFCDDVARFPGGIRIETTPFEVRFDSENGFKVSVSPYRELFLVSIGDRTPCTLRIGSEEDFYAALDLALQHFLESSRG
jgi:hypothetical protein